MRLIDADEAIINFGFEWDDIGPSRGEVVEFLRKQPTIDAVPVVRCRECKHHHDCDTHFCDALGMDCPDDSEFFCSYGKRKEGAD